MIDYFSKTHKIKCHLKCTFYYFSKKVGWVMPCVTVETFQTCGTTALHSIMVNLKGN